MVTLIAYVILLKKFLDTIGVDTEDMIVGGISDEDNGADTHSKCIHQHDLEYYKATHRNHLSCDHITVYKMDG